MTFRSPFLNSSFNFVHVSLYQTRIYCHGLGSLRDFNCTVEHVVPNHVSTDFSVTNEETNDLWKTYPTLLTSRTRQDQWTSTRI